jgi:DNA-binding NtrC family response regulator
VKIFLLQSHIFADGRAADETPAQGACAPLTPRILWIADQADVVVSERLSIDEGTSAVDGLDLLRSEEFDAVLVSWPLADWPSAASLLDEIEHEQPEAPVVFYAPGMPATESIYLCRMGAFHVLQSGSVTSMVYFAADSRWALEHAAGCAEENESWPAALVGESREMEQIVERIRLVSSQ